MYWSEFPPATYISAWPNPEVGAMYTDNIHLWNYRYLAVGTGPNEKFDLSLAALGKAAESVIRVFAGSSPEQAAEITELRTAIYPQIADRICAAQARWEKMCRGTVVGVSAPAWVEPMRMTGNVVAVDFSSGRRRG